MKYKKKILNYPHFICIGPPKSASTWVSDHLKFNKDICGPWMVPREGKKIYNLHRKMDIATEVMANEKFYYFVVTKDRFLERREYFKSLGFGLIK